ncbi:type I-F CRISPR-associated protein Csy1 [Psychrobacter arenosus]|uniref:type I-F CRISPR-associated protein Csy1 n=1 Tax=Psychrobacter arenosus TaxID=256326 RepID=UPI001917D4D7|nr:type I-F CRISPR-associated protein Csy1 [Psychrobacter arenosus]
MENQNHISAKVAVHAFLSSLYDKKTDKEQKQLAKAIEDGDSDGASVLTTTLAEAKEKYSVGNWVADAANRMAKQLNFGTHISKGVHPDAKGDNISFTETNDISETLVGTHSIQSHYIDANGNAAALPLAAFFDFAVNEKTKIRDLILSDNADFTNSLAKEQQTAKEYHQVFKTALQNLITQPITHERNKQTLWPTNAYSSVALAHLDYITTVPLYPSVLTHEVYQRINHVKFSEENKSARDNRFKKTAEQQPYVSLNNLATLQLGGTKPQNVSLLMSKQGGRNYLLPSMPPPMLTRTDTFKPSKFANSIFGSALAHKAKPALSKVFKAVKDQRNIVDIRDARKQAIDEILNYIFESAEHLRSTMPVGWSKDYELDDCEKYWLDPLRAELDGQADFKAKREDSSAAWHQQIIHNFARWLNSLLQDEFKEIKREFADAEHLEWEREIEAMTKLYERAGRGVFL